MLGKAYLTTEIGLDNKIAVILI